MENCNLSNLPLPAQKVQSRLERPLQYQAVDRFIPNRAVAKQAHSDCHFHNDSPQNLLKDCILDSCTLFSRPNIQPLSSFELLQNQQSLVQKNIQKKKEKRTFPTAPEKILDAPDIRDDYYLNLIDWGQNGMLGVSLAASVYLLHPTGQAVRLLQLDREDLYVSAVSWMGDSNILAAGISDGSIQLWDAERAVPIRQIKGHLGRVSSLNWNQKVLSSGSLDQTIRHSDVRQPNPVISTFNAHQKEVCGLKWSLDGKYLASGGNDNALYVWDARDVASNSPQPISSLLSHKAAVKGLAWCPWQDHILASGGGTQDRCLKIWNVQNSQQIKSIQTDSQISSIEFSKIEKEIITAHGYQRNQISIWDYNTYKLMGTLVNLGELNGHQDRVLHISLNPQGNTLVSAATDETLRFWNIYQYQEAKKKTEKHLTSPRLLR